jgi:hypothetical protein
MHMIELEQRLAAPGGLVVSGTGSSKPIPVRKAGKAVVAGFLYEWFPAPPQGKVHIASPERLYFLDPSSGSVVGEERFPDGGRKLGPSTLEGAPPSEADRVAALDAMDRLFVAFANDEPLKGDLEKDAVVYRTEFKRSVEPALLPYYLRVGKPWFDWVGVTVKP